MAQGNSVDVIRFVNIPVSIILGIILGCLFGFLLSWIFEFAHKRKNPIRQSIKVIILLGLSFLLMSIEAWLEGLVSVSGLLAVMSMACTVQIRCRKSVTEDLSKKYGKVWIAAEVMLFVLVGAAVDVRYTLAAGPMVLVMIFIALAFRSIGVILCLIGTNINVKERLFCVFAYLPKATVQAAIGSIPLSLGLSCGNIVLSVAVLAILVTAPLGAIIMDVSYKRLLKKE